MKTFKKLAIIVASAAAISVGTTQTAQAASFASFIDFESLGNGDQTADDIAISNQFWDSHGVSFGLDNDMNGEADSGLLPRLEKKGTDTTDGFVNGTQNKNDVAAPGFEERLGNYFLRTGGLGGNGGNLLISYREATRSVSGELWDIDGNNNGGRTEKWEIQALGVNNSIIGTIITPEGTNSQLNQQGGELDGKPFLWAFDNLEQDIHAIRFVFKGKSSPRQVGLAFDNFSVRSVEGKESVPEPASILGLLAMGAFGTISTWKRKQN
jgi:hypothetical protein